MLKLSLMTLNMMFQFGFKYLAMDHDAEDYEENWLEMMDLVRDSGFEAVDVTSIELMILGEEKISRYLSERNLSVSSIIDMDSYLDTAPETFEKKLEQHKEVMDTAVHLGTNVVMLALGAMGADVFRDRNTEQDVHSALLKYFVPLSEYGKSLGLHVVVEDTPNMAFYLDRAAELEKILEQAPDLEVVYDSGNMILVHEDPVEYFKEFADRTAHVHLKDIMRAPEGMRGAEIGEDGTPFTAAPAGTGIVDMPALIREIKNSSYEGYLTVEYAKHPDKNWLDSLKASREYYETLLRE